jgi:dephospho-CoA kinase
MVIIGITGTIGAGKGTLVEYLADKKGFAHYSVRTFLLEKIRELGMPENRDSMYNLANELRSVKGPSYVVDTLYERAVISGKDCVIESIRTTGEVDSLRAKGSFILLAVDADPDKRYQRIVMRQSETDRVSLATFRENEAREMTTDDPGKQNLHRCIELADFVLTNNGTKEELFLHLGEILNKIQ